MKSFFIIIFICINSVNANQRISVVSDDLPPVIISELQARAILADRDILGFLKVGFQGDILININRHYRIPKALIPAWRGKRGLFELPLSRVEQNREPLVHELTHINAPNHCRYLAEGLAVYLEEKFGNNPAFPNYKESLEKLVAKIDLSTINLAQFDSVGTPKSLGKSIGISEQHAYLISGSFVKFLIKKYDLNLFQDLYNLTPLKVKQYQSQFDLNRYNNIYGKSLSELEKDWKDWVINN